MHKNNYDTQKGQALLFVVVAMTIAMAIGINASIRTISSVSRTTRTDTSTRALAAAEGGIERFLALSIPKLEEVVTQSGVCPIGELVPDPYSCKLIFESSGGDGVISEAYVSVSRYTPDHYTFDLDNGQIKEVNLFDAANSYSRDNIEICWTSTSASGSNISYLAYAANNVKAHGGIKGANQPSGDYEGFVNSGGSKYGYQDCLVVDIGGTDIYGLRIRSLGGSSSIAVYATGSVDLPMQGYEIVSIGRLQQNSGVTASRTIKVVRTLPYLPGSFDYALYSQGSIGN